MILRIIIFLIINFAALGLGGMFTSSAVQGDWYMSLNKAPWTPPGWFFGVAWTTIMICFSFYMAFVWDTLKNRNVLLGLFIVQWILNVVWNPIFFSMQNVVLGLTVITSLTGLIAFIFFRYASNIKWKSVLILPYLIWLFIATTLNAYVLLYN